MDNFDLKKYLVENRVTKQSRLNESLGFKEMEELAKKAAFDFVSKKNLGPVKNIQVVTASSSPDMVGEEYPSTVNVTFSTGKSIELKIIHNADLKLISVTPLIYPTSSPSTSGKKINLTPLQKKEFLDRIKNMDSVNLEMDAANILARVLTNDEAEFIEDVEDFGYNATEVEDYAQELASSL